MLEFINLTTKADPTAATCLLKLDAAYVLLDPGATDVLRVPEWTTRLVEMGIRPDLILLSHADLRHIGALVYGFHKLGWDQSAMYATLPVATMGRLAMHDAVSSTLPPDPSEPDYADMVHITPAMIDAAFDNLITLRYSQPANLSARCNGVAITAYNAGHSLGGAIWKIVKDLESIVYAVSWSHARERHLRASSIYVDGHVPDYLSRPNLLVTDACNALVQVPSRAKRLSALQESLVSVLRDGGSVLIPVDAVTRCLEMCIVLDAMWSPQPGGVRSQLPVPTPQIVLLSPVADQTLSYAKSMTEWMNDAIVLEETNSRVGTGTSSVFDFANIVILTSIDQLKQQPRGPKVVIASSVDLQNGASQAILLDEFANEPRSLVLLTQRTQYPLGSMSAGLLQAWVKKTGAEDFVSSIPPACNVNYETEVRLRRQVPLEGAELEAFVQAEVQRREQQAERVARELRNRNVLEEEEEEGDESDDDGKDGAVGAAEDSRSNGPDGQEGTPKADRMETEAPTQRIQLGSAALSAGFKTDLYLTADDATLRELPPRFLMFPHIERKRLRIDDFGEVLSLGNMAAAAAAADQRQQQDKPPLHSHALEDGTAKNGDLPNDSHKRKWDVVDANASSATTTGATPTKTISETVDVRVVCRVQYIDMEGLHDSRSLKTIVPQITPRQMILTAATLEEQSDMLTHCEQMPAFTRNVYMTADMQCPLDVSVAIASFPLRISEALMRGLHWKRIQDLHVAHVAGRITDLASERAVAAASGDGENNNAIDLAEEDDGTLVLAPLDARQRATATGAAAGSSSLFVGDVRLPEVRHALLALGMKAEFRGEGVLLCGGRVALRKAATGHLMIEGQPSDEFYAVRRTVYDMLASV